MKRFFTILTLTFFVFVLSSAVYADNISVVFSNKTIKPLRCQIYLNQAPCYMLYLKPMASEIRSFEANKRYRYDLYTLDQRVSDWVMVYRSSILSNRSIYINIMSNETFSRFFVKLTEM